MIHTFAAIQQTASTRSGLYQKKKAQHYVNDFYELGQAIAGVPQDTSFKLEGDKHNYVYTIDTDGDDKAEMTIGRV